jgi:hypothetical protein
MTTLPEIPLSDNPDPRVREIAPGQYVVVMQGGAIVAGVFSNSEAWRYLDQHTSYGRENSKMYRRKAPRYAVKDAERISRFNNS